MILYLTTFLINFPYSYWHLHCICCFSCMCVIRRFWRNVLLFLNLHVSQFPAIVNSTNPNSLASCSASSLWSAAGKIICRQSSAERVFSLINIWWFKTLTDCLIEWGRCWLFKNICMNLTEDCACSSEYASAQLTTNEPSQGYFRSTSELIIARALPTVTSWFTNYVAVVSAVDISFISCWNVFSLTGQWFLWLYCRRVSGRHVTTLRRIERD